MFYPFSFEYRIGFDAAIYGGIVWPFAETLGGLAAAVMGLLSLWLALGKRVHWFLRTLPVLTVVWSTVLVPAYDLGLVAATQCIVVLLAVRLMRKPASHQFRLSNLLLIVFVVAASLGYVARVPRDTWSQSRSILWFGIGFGVLTLLAAAIASRKGKLGWRWLLVLVAPCVAFVVAWLRVARVYGGGRPHRGLLSLLSSFIVAPVLIAFATLLYREPIPVSSPPNENGLPEVCAAGESLPPALFQPFPPTPLALSAAVNQAAQAMRKARVAMEKPGWVGVNYQLKDADDFTKRIPQRDSVVQVCRALLAEAELAERERRMEDALASYRDIVKLAETSGRGGLPMDAGLAIEIEGDSLGRVYSIRNSLTKEQCAAWIRFLLDREPAFESSDLLLRRRRAWVDRIATWQDRLVLRWLRFCSLSLVDRKVSHYEQDRSLRIGLLTIELALRAYHLDHAEYPRNLVELLPSYLPSLPEDPLNPDGFVYHPTDEGVILYSIGPDGNDDGGQLPSGPYWVRPGDLSSDVLSLWAVLK